MSQTKGQSDPEFDQYAAEYDAALAEGISVSGEDKSYFARERIVWLKRCLARLQCQPGVMMDFGCGTGTATPYLMGLPGAGELVGVDVSAKSLAVAREICGSEQVRFFELGSYRPAGEVDLAFCNGVFHHIPVEERAEAVRYVHESLRPGGLFSCWENNPWNPGTRYVMKRIPFDRDAVTLTPPEANRLLRGGGFEVLRTDFLFWFPRILSWFRWVEPWMSFVPLGAQYQVLCRKGGVPALVGASCG